ASVTLLDRKLERIAQELQELAELDSYLTAYQRQTIGMALGTRPWTMSWVTGLKKRASPSPEGQLQTKIAERRGR
ncbi:MAG: hypothetical protein ACK53F_13640, partial [Betaproteobacteria bacterium]